MRHAGPPISRTPTSHTCAPPSGACRTASGCIAATGCPSCATSSRLTTGGGGAWRGPSKARRSTTETPAAAAQTLDHEPQPLKPQTPYPPARSLWGTAAARRRRCATPSTPPWQVGVGSGRGGGLVQHNRKAAQASVLPLRRECTHMRGDGAADKGHRSPRIAPAAAAGLRRSRRTPAPPSAALQTPPNHPIPSTAPPTPHTTPPNRHPPQASSWLPPTTQP